ncbi:AraC family transcriptional regulator [Alkaliphilus serpentinus]|uniref:AraC family transcriptional regulator n=1 Tax=Alkaliphilus serpentinus TaxID=1482731 RepID=UPI0018657D6C|nr:AraC family transcriptional regulator [Alkaliphilus serpentinus]
MEWLNRLRDCIDYLEEHLEEKFDIDEVARISLTSKFHFQRLFHMITGITVAEYVRKRRLTLAAQMLATSDAKIIDVALKYGYQSPEAFTKAFNRIHGINPSEVKEKGISLKAYPRLSFQLQIKGEEAMNYRIVEKESFKVIGVSKKVTTVDGENFKIIPRFWQEVNGNGTCEDLKKYCGDLGMLGICADFDHEAEEFTYMIASEKTVDKVPEAFEEREIPAATWAIFESIGPMPHAIQEVFKRIYSEWFPATGYEHADAPELEVYLPGNPDAENYKCEVWIPVIKN